MLAFTPYNLFLTSKAKASCIQSLRHPAAKFASSSNNRCTSSLAFRISTPKHTEKLVTVIPNSFWRLVASLLFSSDPRRRPEQRALPWIYSCFEFGIAMAAGRRDSQGKIKLERHPASVRFLGTKRQVTPLLDLSPGTSRCSFRTCCTVESETVRQIFELVVHYGRRPLA